MISDTAFGDNLDDRKSSQGYILKLFGGAIYYRSGKQNTVTTSSTEAELLALSQAAKELMAFKRLYKGINFEFNSRINLFYDNRQTIQLINEDLIKLVTKLRHVDIYNH